MTPIEILQAIRDDRNVRFLDDTLDKAIDYLKMDTVHFKDIIKAINELENLKVKIKEDEEKFKELLRENTASKESLKQSMLNYDECYDKLVKCQKYIVELETRLRVKEYPLKDIKDECMFDNGWMNK